MRRVVIAAAAVAAFVVVALLLARRIESSMIFFPTRYPSGEWDPARLGVVATEHAFRTEDGLTLYGWWFPAQQATATSGGERRGVISSGELRGAVRDSEQRGSVRGGEPSEATAGREPRDAAPGDEPRRSAPGGEPVLLWAHGNAGNLTGRAPHAQEIAARGVSVFVFDYRGYGKSQGEPSEEGVYRDAEAAYAFITEERGVPARRLVLLGRSLGSAPAAYLARRLPHAGLVLVSPLPSAGRMARRMFGGLPVDWLVRARFPVRDWVAQRRTPLLVIHGERDDIIPIEFGREVFDAAAEPKEFLELAGAGHNDILMAGGDAYLDGLVDFARAAVRDACAGGGC